MDVRGRLFSAVALAALALPGSAAGALEVRLAVVPSPPTVGDPTVVRLRPYWPYNRPDGTCCRLVPANVNYPFRVEAVSPAGRVSRITVRKTGNRYLWAGSFVFRRAGRWTVRAPQWGPRYSTRYGARPRIRFSVIRAPAVSAASSATSVGVVPTRTPAASSASFFAWAVPEEPEMMAPACPIVLPGGAVKPAMYATTGFDS